MTVIACGPRLEGENCAFVLSSRDWSVCYNAGRPENEGLRMSLRQREMPRQKGAERETTLDVSTLASATSDWR